MFIDTQKRKDRLHKGDLFQHYDGEPTILGILLGLVILISVLSVYLLTQI
ncbi:MAG: hypothetical protein RLZZ546_2157 [Bacteroidota bacterium]|jgi:hypothetical protein